MAIYHLSIKIISRSKGKSAVAAAAYRAAETITNDYDGVTHDYTNKRGIIHTEILLPSNAPAIYANRSVLWNAVEKSERYKTAQLAREIELALPVELTREQNVVLVRDYTQKQFADAGMCADVCVHDKGDVNPHAHIMLTMRPIEPDGSWSVKSRTVDGKKIPSIDWNEQYKAEEWRAAWSDAVNTFFKDNNIGTQIDHRSYERQGIEQIPTVHLGVAATRLERRGIRTELGDRNREIGATNGRLRQLNSRIGKLKNWLAEEVTNTKPLALADVITEILTRQGQSGISRLQAASHMLIFLRRNDIYDMAGLVYKVKSMQGKLRRLHEDLKPINRRIETLDEHIRHSENFKNYRKFKKQYDELYASYKTARKVTGFGAERKAKRALDAANEYYESHRSELIQFDAAENYLRDVLQERFDPKKLPPITKWREERDAKIAERDALYQEYYMLKDETKKVEQIKRSVQNILNIEPTGRNDARNKSRNYHAR